MGQADVSTTTAFSVGLGNQCCPCQSRLNKRAQGKIIQLMNLSLVLLFHAEKTSLFSFAGMQLFQATLPYLYVGQFIHFHPSLR